MSNIVLGSRFEREFCERLRENGFWALRIPQSASGQQPADVVAIKGRYHALIDCKVVSTKHGFSFERVEDNQRIAMHLFRQKCNEWGWFAILTPEMEIRMMSYAQLSACERVGMKSLPLSEMRNPCYTGSFEEWVRRADEWK